MCRNYKRESVINVRWSQVLSMAQWHTAHRIFQLTYALGIIHRRVDTATQWLYSS